MCDELICNSIMFIAFGFGISLTRPDRYTKRKGKSYMILMLEGSWSESIFFLLFSFIGEIRVNRVKVGNGEKLKLCVCPDI